MKGTSALEMEECDQDCGVRRGGGGGGEGGVTEAADVQYIWRNIVQVGKEICGVMKFN